MQPELDIGDIVIVRDVKEEQLKVGDIISYRQGQNVITHRVIEILPVGDNKQFRTKGDNNNVEDNKTIEINSIEGKVIGKIPYMGNIALILQGKLAIIIMIIIFYAYLTQSEKIKKKKESRRMKRIDHEQRNK